jgi:hypothetical protein
MDKRKMRKQRKKRKEENYKTEIIETHLIERESTS